MALGSLRPDPVARIGCVERHIQPEAAIAEGKEEGQQSAPIPVIVVCLSIA